MQTERIRQTLTSPLTLDQLQSLQNQGWKAVAVEWEREMPQPQDQVSKEIEEPPFGLRVGDDCLTLQQDPEETETLATIMELIIQDGPYSSIAQELNRRGYLTRRGTKWSPVSVFEMLPRLIEAGPKILSSQEWHHRRQQSLQRRQRQPM